jgi:hypothetical protein
MKVVAAEADVAFEAETVDGCFLTRATIVVGVVGTAASSFGVVELMVVAALVLFNPAVFVGADSLDIL